MKLHEITAIGVCVCVCLKMEYTGTLYPTNFHEKDSDQQSLGGVPQRFKPVQVAMPTNSFSAMATMCGTCHRCAKSKAPSSTTMDGVSGELPVYLESVATRFHTSAECRFFWIGTASRKASQHGFFTCDQWKKPQLKDRSAGAH